jgi:hypothetical protein
MSNGTIPPSAVPMSPARAVFERLARRTWMFIPSSEHLNCRFLETTFTDLNLFEIAAAQLPNVRVYKAQGVDEPEKGFDWEWWIGRPGNYWRYSVQAKLLKYSSQRYPSLRHWVGERQQIEILEDFSVAQGTIPLYCFYNSVSDEDAEAGWHCNLQRDNSQLGCTLVPLDAVKMYTNPWRRRNFVNLHTDERSIPWRCLITCPTIIGSPSDPLGPPYRDVSPIEQLPAFLAAAQIREDRRVPIIDLPHDLYTSELGGHPKNIAVIDVHENQLRSESVRVPLKPLR